MKTIRRLANAAIGLLAVSIGELAARSVSKATR
jgi:hypothetical protein